MHPKTAKNEEIGLRSAQLTIEGIKLIDQLPILSKEFGEDITKFRLEGIRRKEAFKEVLEKHRKELVADSLGKLRQGVSRLTDKILVALESGIDDGNMQSVKLALEALGVYDKHREVVTDNGPLTVIMSGSESPSQPALKPIEQIELDDSQPRIASTKIESGNFETDEDGSLIYKGKNNGH